MTLSLYQQVLGERFGRLAAPLQRFHCLPGHHVMTGWVQTVAPSTLIAKLLAACVGAPLRSSEGVMRFELDAQLDCETWSTLSKQNHEFSVAA